MTSQTMINVRLPEHTHQLYYERTGYYSKYIATWLLNKFRMKGFTKKYYFNNYLIFILMKNVLQNFRW